MKNTFSDFNAVDVLCHGPNHIEFISNNSRLCFKNDLNTFFAMRKEIYESEGKTLDQESGVFYLNIASTEKCDHLITKKTNKNASYHIKFKNPEDFNTLFEKFKKINFQEEDGSDHPEEKKQKIYIEQ